MLEIDRIESRLQIIPNYNVTYYVPYFCLDRVYYCYIRKLSIIFWLLLHTSWRKMDISQMAY